MTSFKDGPLAAFALALATTVGIVVMTCTGHAVPAELWALDTALVGGGLGITNPTSTSRVASDAADVDQAIGK